MKPDQNPWMVVILLSSPLPAGAVEKVLGSSVCRREARHDIPVRPAESLLSRKGDLTIWIDHYREPWQDSSGDDTGDVSPMYSQAAAEEHLLSEPWSLKRAIQQHRGSAETLLAAQNHVEYVVLRVPLQPAGHALNGYDALLDLAGDFLARTLGSCFFNPRAEVLCSAEELQAIRERDRIAGLPPIELLIHARAFELAPGWALADSVGLSQLELPDQEVAFNKPAMGKPEALEFVKNLASHLITHRTPVASGDTAGGPNGTLWEALLLGQASLAPHRKIIRWLPENREGMPAGLDVP